MKYLYFVALIDYLIVLSTTATASRIFTKDKGRIISGHYANYGEFPYMVTVEATKSNVYKFCGGSLIEASWILTAAHCVDDIDSLLVYLGSTLLESAEVGYVVPLDHVVINSDYDPEKLRHDIALIWIPATDLCGSVSTIALPTAQTAHQYYVGEPGLISGWGSTGSGGPLSKRLQWGYMLVVDNEVCRKIDPTTNIAELCAEPVDNAAPCDGDSGGALVSESTLIGVVSHHVGSDNCEDGVPFIFARVSFYLEWINDVTGIST